ncbi:MAG: hypothetical protein ABIK73_07280 [candidate division WOR-3 bacterium]
MKLKNEQKHAWLLFLTQIIFGLSYTAATWNISQGALLLVYAIISFIIYQWLIWLDKYMLTN